MAVEKIHIGEQFKHLETKFNQVLTDFDEQGQYVMKGQRNQIKKFEIEGTIFNFKQFKKPNFINAFVYRFIRKSKAERSYKYANKLLSVGILTPEPVGFIEHYNVIGLRRSYYVSRHLDYDFDFRVLIHQPKFENREIILEQFTDFTFKLHENNFEFLDHSPGNTLIKKISDHTYDFYLIDLNRMRFRTLNFNQRMYNFRRLWLSKTMVKIISNSYAKLYNKPVDDTHKLMLKYSRAYQKKIDSKKLRRSGRKMRFKN